MKIFIVIILSLFSLSTYSQDGEMVWWNPADSEFPVIEGQAWGTEVKATYDRLPERAQESVRERVLNLAKQTAGLMIRFRTNSNNITIRYQVGNRDDIALNHMPATGVSGVDLYAIDSDGKELWSAGRRSFGDTITYKFNNLVSQDQYHKLGNEYRLYLPLYNKVDWLEIGVAEQAHFEALPVRNEKPIVVYGTSIAQGACASRPGMAWTAILGRKMDRPLINLGFSGTGLLDIPIIDLISEIDAKIYALDCLPNLIGMDVSDGVLQKRIVDAVVRLRERKSSTPILLVDHAGYTDGSTKPSQIESYERVNKIQAEAFYELKLMGHKNLYYLTLEEINLGQDDMVDGVHPNDLGMQHYADSYEKKLRNILKEPIGMVSTTRPITQYREPGNYDWEKRHREILELNEKNPPKTILIANSIIHFWGGKPTAKIARDEASWESILTPAGVKNYAYGWDRIENVLWRVYHGELDGFDAERILVMIGTNNLHLNTNEEILDGLTLLIQAIKSRQVNAEITLMGILPRRDYESRIKSLNNKIASIASNISVKYADLGYVFLNEDKHINESLFSDGLHPNKAGYQKLILKLEPLVK